MSVLIVQALLVALKLLGIVSWSWWIILAPLWGAAALILIALAVFNLGNHDWL